MDEDRKSVADGAGDSLKDRPRVAADGADPPQVCVSALPPRLRRRLEASAEAWICSSAGGKNPPAIPRQDAVHWQDRASKRIGWYAAAACLLLAIVGWWPRLEAIRHDAPGVSPLQAEAERGRAQLLRSDGRHLDHWAWSQEAGLQAGVQGEVVWDGEHQQGYLTLNGLQPSIGTGRQYQLWIFDAARDDRYPVDGGVFDVPPDPRTLTVPIRPSLKVSRPVAFALTFEPAGGVVVSDRRHVVALAHAGGF
jgi:hypothetical protein